MGVLLLLIVSVAIGFLLRGWRQLRILEHTSTWTVWLLIFVFGISLGSNDTIIKDFPHFGLTAFVIALAGIVGSVFAAWGIGRCMNKRKDR